MIAIGCSLLLFLESHWKSHGPMAWSGAKDVALKREALAQAELDHEVPPD